MEKENPIEKINKFERFLNKTDTYPMIGEIENLEMENGFNKKTS